MGRSLLGIEDLDRAEIERILDRAVAFQPHGGANFAKVNTCTGMMVVNAFFENSTRTRSSFEIAAHRLGADTLSITAAGSSVAKGESLVDTLNTLAAMRPSVIVMRHQASGAPHFLARHLSTPIVNAGDGTHEHPTQALLDARTILDRLGRLEGLRVAIIGDIQHSRVARSNILLLQALGARVRVIAPPTLLPAAVESLGVEAVTDMRCGLEGADIVMMLRLQSERMQGSLVPSVREYFHFFGLTHEKLEAASPDAMIMHPGPMNRGVEIDGPVADDINRSAILDQVEMGVAVRMAVLDALTRRLRAQG